MAICTGVSKLQHKKLKKRDQNFTATKSWNKKIAKLLKNHST